MLWVPLDSSPPKSDPGFRATIESNARRYAETVLDPEFCRDLYLNVAHLEELKKAASLTPS